MKLFLMIVALTGAALGEAPATSGPYPPSGWKPSGPLLALPARQQAYGAPAPQPPAEYGPPQEYGPPATEATGTPEATETPADQPEDTPSDSERIVDSGVYYVLQADGKLQMVRYTTAPLKQKKSFQQQKFSPNRFGDASNFDSQRIKPGQFQQQQQKQVQLTQVQAHQAQFQYKPDQFNQQPAQFNQQSAQFNQQPAQFNQQSAQFNQQPAQFSQQQTQFSQQSSQFNQQYQSSQYNQQPAQTNPEPTPFHYIEVQRSVEVPVVQPTSDQANSGYVANIQYRDVEPISAPIYAYNPNPLVRILKK